MIPAKVAEQRVREFYARHLRMTLRSLSWHASLEDVRGPKALRKTKFKLKKKENVLRLSGNSR